MPIYMVGIWAIMSTKLREIFMLTKTSDESRIESIDWSFYLEIKGSEGIELHHFIFDEHENPNPYYVNAIGNKTLESFSNNENIISLWLQRRIKYKSSTGAKRRGSIRNVTDIIRLNGECKPHYSDI